MRRNNVRILSTILAGTFMCITLLACKNFLNANNVSDEIKDAIAYNNAKSVNLAIDCKQEMGSIFPSPSYTAKVGYDFEIQLLLNEDYYVVKDPSTMLEAVSRIDETVSRSENVEFQVEKQNLEDKRTGLYRIKTKIIKYADDILIRPSCYELPILTDHTPDSLTRTAFSNESIVLTFNIPMEDPETDAAATAAIFNYNNILITYNGDSVSDLFESPVFNAEKTKLSITPKPITLQKYINDRKLPVILFDVYVSQDIKATIDGVSIPLLLNNHNSFSVSYKADFETTPPAKRELFITNTPIEIETAGSVNADEKYSEIDLSEQGSYTDDQYKNLVYQNTTTGDGIYIYGKFFDADSGIKTVNVYYEKKYNAGNVIQLPAEQIAYYSKSYTEDSPELELLVQGTETLFCLKTSLQGAGEYSITVCDACGNESGNNSFSIFKPYIQDLLPTSNNDSVDGLPKQVINQPCKQISPEIWTEFNETEFYQQLKQLTYTVGNTSLWKSVNYPLDQLSVLCRYNGKTEPFAPTKNTNSISWDITLDVASVSGLPITLIIKDTFGLYREYDYYFPDKNENWVAEDVQSDSAYGTLHNYKFYGQSIGFAGYWYMVRTNKSTGEKEYRFNHNDALEPNYNYSIIYDSGFEGGKLLGEMPADFSFDSGSFSDDSVEPISISENQVSLEKVTTEGKLKVKVTVAFTQAQLAKYDLIFIDGCANSVSYKNTVPKDTGIYTFEMDPKYLYKSYCRIYVDALKNGKKVNTSESYYTIQHPSNSDDLYKEFDDNPPHINFDYNHTTNDSIKFSEEYIIFSLLDDETGPKSGTIYLNKNTEQSYDFELKNDKYLCEIPFNDIFPYSTYEQEISYSLEDNAGNKITGTRQLYSPLSFKEYYEYVDKEENYIYLKMYNYAGDSRQIYAFAFNNGFPITYNSSSGTCSVSIVNGTIDNKNHTANIKISTYVHFPESTYVKLVNNIEGWGHPFYYYNGTYSGTGQYNGIYKIGNSKSAIGVCSDGPVYVHTLVTKVPYEICKDWDHLEWEYNKKSLNEKILDITTPVQQRYTIPVGDIDDGSCYVVIAHYANNKIDVSEVMQK